MTLKVRESISNFYSIPMSQDLKKENTSREEKFIVFLKSLEEAQEIYEIQGSILIPIEKRSIVKNVSDSYHKEIILYDNNVAKISFLTSNGNWQEKIIIATKEAIPVTRKRLMLTDFSDEKLSTINLINLRFN